MTYFLAFIVDLDLCHLFIFYMKDNLQNLLFLNNQIWVLFSFGYSFTETQAMYVT